MSDAINMIGFAFLLLVGICINSIAWWKSRWWVMPLSFMWWGGLAYWCSEQSDAYKTGGGAMDHYRLFMWLCVGMMLLSVGELWMLYKNSKKQDEVEDDMMTRTSKRVSANLAGTFGSESFKNSRPRTRQSGGFPTRVVPPRSTGKFPPRISGR